ncbi:TetR/AcrR family transcriptional regulator [Dactylosporangium cerinum]
MARQAGVARSTVCLVFGSRGGLFDALAPDVLDRGGFADLLVAVRATDPREHLRGDITATVRMYASQHDALAALQTHAAKPDGAMQRAGEARLGGLRHLADRLHAAGLLRVPHATAVDTLWLLTAFETFDTLHTGRDLPAATVADHCTALAEPTLLVLPSKHHDHRGPDRPLRPRVPRRDWILLVIEVRNVPGTDSCLCGRSATSIIDVTAVVLEQIRHRGWNGSLIAAVHCVADSSAFSPRAC